MSKIIELRAENFKRLKAVRISFDGKGKVITGRNAQGKSSVLHAIMAALGGADSVPDMPVRKGQERAEVSVDLGDIIVTRSFTPDGKGRLVVRNKDGARFDSPQAVLDRLVGRLTFNPLAFMRMNGPTQASTLRQLVGLDVSAHEREAKAAYDERTLANREVKALQGSLAKLPTPPEGTPDTPIPVADLARELREATDTNARLASQARQAERDAQEAHRSEVAAMDARGRAENALRDAQAKLDAAVEAVRSAQRMHEHAKELAKTTAERAKAERVDTSPIEAKMETADTVNAAVRVKHDRTTRVAELDEWMHRAAALTARIEAADKAKAEALGAVKFPVDGLGVEGDTVTMNGIPLVQASAAEQLRACLAIGGALHPQLRTVLIEDGSLLDNDSMRLVDEWAEANDMQIIMERVADKERVGVLIEDGEVVPEPKAQS